MVYEVWIYKKTVNNTFGSISVQFNWHCSQRKYFLSISKTIILREYILNIKNNYLHSFGNSQKSWYTNCMEMLLYFPTHTKKWDASSAPTTLHLIKITSFPNRILKKSPCVSFKQHVSLTHTTISKGRRCRI